MIQSEPSGELDASPASIRGPAGAMADLVSRLAPNDAAAEIRRVLDVERDLVADNLLAPYADMLPVALALVCADRTAAALEQLPAALACRALFGSFRALPTEHVSQILASMVPRSLAGLLGEMAFGYDLPTRAARLLTAMGGRSGPALLLTEPAAAARIAGLMPLQPLTQAFTTMPVAAALAWLSRVLKVASPWEVAALLGALDGLPFLDSAQRIAVVPEHVRRVLLERDDPTLDGLEDGSSPQALRRIPAVTAGILLSEIARSRPAVAGFLLSTMADLLLVRGPDGERRRVLHAAPGAAVLATLDPADPRTCSLMEHADEEVLADLLSRLDPAHAADLARASGTGAPGWTPAAYPAVAPTGQRRSRSLGPGVRWVQLRERTEQGGRGQPLRIDLVELNLNKVRLRACVAPDPDPPISASALTRSLSSTRRGGSLPAEEELASLGLVRLAPSMGETGAIAGINGNFYFDYGHCLDANDLGLDLSQETALHFGDLVGWFVSDGATVSPALFGRAVLAITSDGRAHIRRVSMTALALVSGRRLTWDAVNQPSPGGTVLYDRRAGPSTPESSDLVDFVIAGGTIVEIRPGGGARIPLLGVVLSVPRPLAAETMAEAGVGQPVEVLNDFPSALGRVAQAMACGPQLVRGGQIDIDLDAEGFGDKDSSVLPLSLTRAVDSLRAARSFVFIRDGLLTLGVVSGTQLGSGAPRVSAGVTFGELAQLCADLGADEAIALDGGGSSSVAALVDGSPKVLSVPTGGGDVPEGVERFLKTYWLVFPS